jgi:phospholipase/carboxylesterase
MRPRDYEPDRTYPLPVALHGYGGDAEGLSRAFASMAGLPVLVALPQGEYANPWGGFSWFPVTGDRSQGMRTDERSVSRVLRCLSEVQSRERVGKVIVFGFSQGASLAYLTGLRNPGLVDGIAAVGGSLPEIGAEGAILKQDRIARAKRVAVFIARGKDDPYLDRESFRRQREFLDRNGYRVESLEYEGGHQLTRPLLARLWLWIERSVRARN